MGILNLYKNNELESDFSISMYIDIGDWYQRIRTGIGRLFACAYQGGARMKRGFWRRMLSVGCIAAMLMTAPGMSVLAEESQQEEILTADMEEEVVDDSSGIQDDSSMIQYEESVANIAEEAADASVSNETEYTDEQNEEPEKSTNDTEVIIGETLTDELSVEEEESLIADDSDLEATEELIGDDIIDIDGYSLGNGVYATVTHHPIYSPRDPIIYDVELFSKGGTLPRNWQEKLDITQKLPEDWRYYTRTIKTSTSPGGIFYLPVDSSKLFAGFEHLEEIINFNQVNTSKVQNMSMMFSDCCTLENIDFSKFNTSSCTDMSSMFHNCKSLKNPDFSKFNTSKVTNFGSMFYGCESIETLDLSGFDTSSALYIGGMFNSCAGLTEVNLSSFDTSNVINMWGMFNYCISLKELDLSSFDTSSVEDTSAEYSSYLYGLDMLSVLKTPKVNTCHSALPRCMYDKDANSYDETPILSHSITLTSYIDIQNSTITLNPTSYTYNGTARKPAVTVKVGKITLASGTDYTVSYSNNTNAGNNATVIVTGKGRCRGKNSKTFTIAKAAPTLTFEQTSLTKKISDAAFTNALTKKTDGKVSFSSGNTAVATVNSTSGLVTIKGIGKTTISATATAGTNYAAGSASYTLTVTDGKRDISGLTVTLSANSYTYDGSYKKPGVTVKDSKIILKSGTDYTVSYLNNKNAGTATVTVKGIGNYKGEKSVDFTIKKAKPVLTFAEANVTKTMLDEPFVNTLTKVTDGKIAFKSGNISVATVNSISGLVTIEGKGTTTITVAAAAGKNYEAGAAQYTLKVGGSKIDISKGKASTKYKVYEYTGKNRQPAMILKVGNTTLVKDVDYTLSYRNNKNVGTATVTATGIGKYEGTISCTFYLKEIVPVYRLFNRKTGEHFYTVSTSERQKYLNAGNWNAEGIAWYAPKKSSEPIYRLSNPNNGNEHHYTKSKSEKDWLVGLGWRYDCIAWYSDTDKVIPIYRHYHPIQRTGNHHYTTSKGESDHIVKYEGWRYEGVSFYVSKAGG